MEQEPTKLQLAMDDATAARITAWVLGEASAFEAEQLEELCRTYPEWRNYEQSQRVLHSFIAEAEKAADDDEQWKISPEKRDALLEKISRPTKAQKKRWKVSRQSLVRAACITVFFGLSGLYISQSFVKNADLAMAPMAEKSIQDQVQLEKSYMAESRTRQLEDEVQEQSDRVTEIRKKRDNFLSRAPRVIVDLDNSVTHANPADLAANNLRASDASIEKIREYDYLADKQPPPPPALPKTSAPSSSTVEVIAGMKRSNHTIPVPAASELKPSVDFGNGNDYGDGFGSGGDEGVSFAGGAKKREISSAAPGEQSDGPAVVSGKSIVQDRVLRNETQKGYARHVADEGLKASLKQSESDRDSTEIGKNKESNERRATRSGFIEEEKGLHWSYRDQDEKLTSQFKANFGSAIAPQGEFAENGQNKESGAALEKDSRDNKVSKADKNLTSKNLNEGEVLYNLGKLDESKKAYEDVLLKDPYNTDARRGIERINSAKSAYNNSVYDGARAELLAQSEKGLELAIPLTQENPTSVDPYSTFSLRVSDASFQLAYHALQKGNRPQPQEIRSEDFYNAFDYGDAAAADGEPVVCAMEQSAHPFAPQRNLLRLSMAVGASGRSAAQPLHLTLVVDQSGSMERDDRNEIMKAAVAELGKLLTENDRVSVIGFSRTPRLLGENIAGNDLAKWQSLVTAAPNDGGTNLEQALQLGETIATRHKNTAAQNRILLVTDGAANLGNANPENLATRVKEMRQRGLCFDVVGVGTGGESDQRLLELSRNGNGRYQVLQNVEDAKEKFASQLAGAFRPAAENVKVQVRFNDKRVKNFLLHGFEKDRLNTEDFRNDKVDAAEIAANEAGNALYQIQTIPDGEGDVGEASVRFRDPASGMMVERKWTIPWQPAAPAFDQASPSIQLAGLSLQAAQFLQGSPLATPAMSPHFSTMEENVRRQFGNQVNVAKLLEMLRQIK